MNDNQILTEIKTKAATRYPPGDRWQCVLDSTNNKLILENLTDCLEYIFQKTGNTNFYLDAREGYVYVVTSEVQEIIEEPKKNYSLYGE